MANNKKTHPMDQDLTLESAIFLLRTWATFTAITNRDELVLRIVAAVSVVITHIESGGVSDV